MKKVIEIFILLISCLFMLSFTNSVSVPEDRKTEDPGQDGWDTIYSVKLNHSMAAVEMGADLVWPESYTGCSAVIYHYLENASLYFTILDHDVQDSTLFAISSYAVTDMNCEGNDIFSCTYLCRDTSTFERVGIAFDLSDTRLLILINHVDTNSSVAYSSGIKDIVRYLQE